MLGIWLGAVLRKRCLAFGSFFLYSIFLYGIEITNWQIWTTHQYPSEIAGSGDSLFIATSGGLILFSPQKESIERVFTYKDGLLSHYVKSLARDRENSLWLATDYRGVLVFSQEGFLRYPPEKVPSKINKIGLSGDTVILATPEGAYFIITHGTLLDFNDDNVVNLLPGNIAYSLFADDDFWIGTGRGVFRIGRDLQTVRLYLRPLGDSVKGILKARDTLFIATEKGLAYYSATNDTFLPYLLFAAVSPYSSLIIKDFKVKENRFYIASHNGTFTYDGRNFSPLTPYHTTAIFLDEYLLLGILGPDFCSGSLLKIDTIQREIPFRTIVCNQVFSIAKDREENIYLAHLFWGANRITVISKDSITFLKDTLPVPDFVAIDSKDRIWVAHWSEEGGLSCYDKTEKRWRIFQWGTVTPKNVIGAFAIDANDTKWMWNGINLIALDSNDISFEFFIPGLGGCLHGYEFTFDSKKRVYLGTPNGLVMLDYKGTLADPSDDTAKIFTEGLASNNIYSLSSDRKDQIWVATDRGLGLLKGERFRVYTKENSGLISSNCLRVRTDSYDRVWVMTDAGLSIFCPKEDSWFSFTPTNSPILPNWKSILGFYLSLLVEEGNAYIGTKEGLIHFTYKKEEAPEEPLRIEIYPNPYILGLSQKLYVESVPYPESSVVEIFTLRGKKLNINKISRLRNGYALEIDNSLSSGLYIIRVREERSPYRIGLGRLLIIR